MPISIWSNPFFNCLTDIIFWMPTTNIILQTSHQVILPVHWSSGWTIARRPLEAQFCKTENYQLWINFFSREGFKNGLNRIMICPLLFKWIKEFCEMKIINYAGMLCYQKDWLFVLIVYNYVNWLAVKDYFLSQRDWSWVLNFVKLKTINFKGIEVLCTIMKTENGQLWRNLSSSQWF